MNTAEPRFLVVGAGSTGGYFGARLALAGRRVDFLVRKARAAQLRENGLQIIDQGDAFSIRPQLVDAADLERPYEIVLLAVKGFALERAIDDIERAVGPETIIVPLLNGMSHLDAIVKRFGRSAIVGGVCRIVATLGKDGHILKLAPPHELAYGELDATVTERIRRLDAVLQGAGFGARLSADIEREMWEKWVLLATLGAATCLLRGNVGEINSASGGPRTMNAMLDEVISAVEHVGRTPNTVALASIRAALTDASSAQTASLYRDLLVGAAVEMEQVVGDLVARAHVAGVATPLLTAAQVQLSIYGRRRLTA